MSTPSPSPAVQVRRLQGPELDRRIPFLEAHAFRGEGVPLSHHPRWLTVLREGLGHTPYVIEAMREGKTCGFLPLAYVSSVLFGRFLVSLPYLSSNGVLADDEQTSRLLIDEAVRLADELRVRHLELRHERPVEHPALDGTLETKVHMRLPLTEFPGPLWEGFPAKVRNQVRKGEKGGLQVAWGGAELLEEFYAVFSHNMRDLGTPAYGRGFFQAILRHFPVGKDQGAELCVVRAGGRPVAGALLLHGKGVTEVPSASSLRAYNHTSANMLMYWNLLERAVTRGQAVFDFGRSTADSGPFRFKQQWGAVPSPAVWQYHNRGHPEANVRPDNPRYRRLIALWQRLPVLVTRLLGPRIVRGIP
jgi:FemAB-related protein (PEP-CTERM system-associated)